MNMLLRHGAYELYKDNDEDEMWEDEDINQILEKRATKIELEPGKPKEEGEDGASSSTMGISGLSGFSTAKFNFADSGADIDMNDKEFWSKILPPPVTAESLKQKIDSGDLDSSSLRVFVQDLKGLVDVATSSVEFTINKQQEKDTLIILLKQLASHPSFKDHDKKRFAHWCARLTGENKRRAVSIKAEKAAKAQKESRSTRSKKDDKKKSKRSRDENGKRKDKGRPNYNVDSMFDAYEEESEEPDSPRKKKRKVEPSKPSKSKKKEKEQKSKKHKESKRSKTKYREWSENSSEEIQVTRKSKDKKAKKEKKSKKEKKREKESSEEDTVAFDLVQQRLGKKRTTKGRKQESSTSGKEREKKKVKHEPVKTEPEENSNEQEDNLHSDADQSKQDTTPPNKNHKDDSKTDNLDTMLELLQQKSSCFDMPAIRLFGEQSGHSGDDAQDQWNKLSPEEQDDYRTEACDDAASKFLELQQDNEGDQWDTEVTDAFAQHCVSSFASCGPEEWKGQFAQLCEQVREALPGCLPEHPEVQLCRWLRKQK
eukprot:TRINITY_DN62853_c0_g1_i1.p1 TRINITY_DN62853_c0_g1~~TRINITY_DN62853_c0_g1_i1.p1  ORF type:complete len:555 (-),score=87.28 TRINITY_DN62853_c0_g1_i1:41-1663(-)